ncbi:MAG: HAMP domain-containing sensor histidine kinase, partial [Bacteroidales bacterium]|nr:HAMP domain-containing sensor histidine kinase [Bacteroidales bacterium]
ALIIRYFVGLLGSTIKELEENSELIYMQSVQLEAQNEELTELNKTKDKFISILAHDLRTPFNTILGFSQLLMTKFDKISDIKKKDYLHSIQITSEKTYDLLNKLLDWARSQSGSMVYNPEKINLDNLLKENLDLLAESALNKGISMNKDEDVDFTISVDKGMVNTIIRNILSNSIKFTPEKGKISAGCSRKQDEIILEIRDTGIGMNKEELEQLFDIDRTISRSGTANESGSGLGLLLCKEFTEKCGGKLRAESEVGKGSSFLVSFPIVD